MSSPIDPDIIKNLPCDFAKSVLYIIDYCYEALEEEPVNVELIKCYYSWLNSILSANYYRVNRIGSIDNLADKNIMSEIANYFNKIELEFMQRNIIE